MTNITTRFLAVRMGSVTAEMWVTEPGRTERPVHRLTFKAAGTLVAVATTNPCWPGSLAIHHPPLAAIG